MAIIGTVLIYLLYAFLLLLIARLILDYIQLFARSWRPNGVVLVLAEATYTVTDPPLKLLRRFIPPLRLGRIALDLSFMVLFIVVWVMIRIVPALFGA